MEQHDYRRGGKPNVFFGAEKRYLGTKIGVFTFNTVGAGWLDARVAGLAALDSAAAARSAARLIAARLCRRRRG